MSIWYCHCSGLVWPYCWPYKPLQLKCGLGVYHIYSTFVSTVMVLITGHSHCLAITLCSPLRGAERHTPGSLLCSWTLEHCWKRESSGLRRKHKNSAAFEPLPAHMKPNMIRIYQWARIKKLSTGKAIAATSNDARVYNLVTLRALTTLQLFMVNT